MDLFANRSNTHCPRLPDAVQFSLMPDFPDSLKHIHPWGVDVFPDVPWPGRLFHAIFLLHLIPPPLVRVRQERLMVILIAPDHCTAPWYTEMTQLDNGSARDNCPTLWSFVTGNEHNRCTTHDRPTSLGLAPEEERLIWAGLSEQVIVTIQAARMACYKAK